MKRPLQYRMTRLDWDVINEALALYEAEADDEMTEHAHRQIATTRRKVFERMDRAAEKRLGRTT